MMNGLYELKKTLDIPELELDINLATEAKHLGGIRDADIKLGPESDTDNYRLARRQHHYGIHSTCRDSVAIFGSSQDPPRALSRAAFSARADAMCS